MQYIPQDQEVISDQETLNDVLNCCDVSYEGVPSSAAINFNPSFGKISMGEYFKVLFTIQNTSASFNLEELKLKSTVVRVLKNPNPN